MYEHGMVLSETSVKTCSAFVGDAELSSEEQASALKMRADALMAEHSVSQSVTIIEEATALYETVLQLRPLDHALRAEAAGDLGAALERYCNYNGTDIARGERCIRLLRHALELRPPGHPLRDQSLHILARALSGIEHMHESGRTSAISESISLNREALQLRPVGHPDRQKSLNNLGFNLRRWYELSGDWQVLEEATGISRELLDMRPPGHAGRDNALENLAIGLRMCFEHRGGIERLTEAIGLLREALQLRPDGHRTRYQALDNLAWALGLSATFQGRSDMSLESVLLRREALELLAPSHPQRTRIISNLATSLMAAFQHDCVSSDAIGEAIDLLREVLALRQHENRPLDFIRTTLAEALAVKFDMQGCHDDLTEAISLQRLALEHRPAGHWRRSESLQMLGNLLRRLDNGSWAETLTLYREALVFCYVTCPNRASLLSDMSRCFLEPASPFFDLSEGLDHLSEAYSDPFSHVHERLRSAVFDLRRVEEAYTVTTRDLDAQDKKRSSDQVLDLYAQVIDLLPRAANFALDHKNRLQSIAGSDEIARNAAARALHRERIPQAVEMLEEGRGIFWSQTLHLRATGFDGVPGQDRQALEELLHLLEVGTRRAQSLDQTPQQREQDLETHRQMNAQAEALILKIRGYPGLHRFLLPAAFDDLMSALPDGFVIIVNSSTLGCHALLLHRAARMATNLELDLLRIRFDSLSLTASPSRSTFNAADDDELNVRAMRLDRGCSAYEALEDVLALLWTAIAKPIINRLGLQRSTNRSRPRLWWCVTGELGLLPIHAAGNYRGEDIRCTADYVVSSYIPTLTSLIKAQRDWKPISHSQVGGLLVCEESPAQGSARHLIQAAEEVHLARECFESAGARVLNSHSAHTSVAQLRVLLEETRPHILHLACHGVQDLNPLNSGLLLQDGKLTIEKIMELDLPHAVLAYLSACETAKGDRNAPDQAVHLAASMLFCGFRSVIGTMWLMHDEDGPNLARHFYQTLFEHERLDLDDIAYALDEAIQKLRIQGVPARRWALFMHMGG